MTIAVLSQPDNTSSEPMVPAAGGASIHFDASDLIAAESLGKVFGTRAGPIEALRDVRFSIRSGEFISILGPSGCGKSTLLMLLAGLEKASFGGVTIAGKRVEEPYAKAGIVFQDATLMPWRNALDNVLFPIAMTGRPLARYRARAEELLTLVGLSDATQLRPRQLSGGMRQRVALCRSFIDDPLILFLDEPFSALDAISRDEMSQVFLDLWDRHHKTAVFVTHSVREAALLSDRVLVMAKNPGHIIADVRVDFPRPRDFSLSTSISFNRLCERLRELVLDAHGSALAAAKR
jgi:NitT/TauT family transport system ATP-binding protein